MDVPSYKEGESVGFFLAGQHALQLRCGMHGWSSRGHANRRCLLAYRVPSIRRYFTTARAPRRGVAQHGGRGSRPRRRNRAYGRLAQPLRSSKEHTANGSVVSSIDAAQPRHARRGGCIASVDCRETMILQGAGEPSKRAGLEQVASSRAYAEAEAVAACCGAAAVRMGGLTVRSCGPHR